MPARPEPERGAQAAVALASLVDALPYALLSLDAEDVIGWLNPAAEELIGIAARKANGLPLAQLSFGSRLLDYTARARKTRAPVTAYRLSIPFRGVPVLTRVRATPMADSGGVLLSLEPQGHEEALAEEEARLKVARASGLMAAMLAHEIKNPLAGIRGAAQLLGEGEGASELSQLICREVDRIRDIVERVERLSDGQGLPKEEINIHEVLRHGRAVAEASFARGVAFAEEFDPSLPPALAHRAALEQVVLNLIKNAAEALAEAGTKQPAICLRTYALAGRLAVEMRDNGPGVPLELEGRLFEPFASTRGQGRGLGLAVAGKLMAELGGQAELLQAGGGGAGACFRLLVPHG